MLYKFLQKIIPPDNWKLPVLLLTGIFFGLAFYIFQISKAPSYISDKPEACVNCHIMAPQYTTWSHSAHREAAHCNDCHVPHNNVLNKYYFKAKDGLRHATVFTLRAEPQVIFIKQAGADVVMNNCIRCHRDLIDNVQLSAYKKDFFCQQTDRKCWECHRETPHGRVNSLSSVPWARVPLPESPVPAWLKTK